MLNLHTETYTVNNESCRAVADFANETLTIQARGFNQTYPLDDYTNFEGNMLDFVTLKLKR